MISSRNCIIFTSIIILFISCKSRNDIIKKNGVTYDFRFAELAVKFVETGDTSILTMIAELPATDHLLNHARRFNYDVPKESTYALVKYLLSPLEEKRKILPEVERNLAFSRELAEQDLPQSECLKYLPEHFKYQSSLFFTFGYDIGVVYGNNASINLAHQIFLNNQNEIRYYSVHELHHAGFVTIKNNQMPSLDIKTHEQMTKLIAYFTQLEGMGTYAPLDLRRRENAVNSDKDYIALQDKNLMKEYVKSYSEIWQHFKQTPQDTLTDPDWQLLGRLSNNERLWYRAGAAMASEIDSKYGRQKLTELLKEDPEKFITLADTL